jgi:hypothetical protein
MPEEREKTPQEQIMEGIWRIALQTVVILVSIGAGVFIGFQLWGDAPELKEKLSSANQHILELKNEREAEEARNAMCERDKNDFKKRLDKVFDRNNDLQRQVAELKQQLGG